MEWTSTRSPGDLINQMNTSATARIPSATRLNPSFGAITYADNDRHGNYNAVIFDITRALFARIRGCVVHSFPCPGRCAELSEFCRAQSWAVLRTIHLRRAKPFLSQLQLPTERVERRTRSIGICDGRLGNQRDQHLPVGVSV